MRRHHLGICGSYGGINLGDEAILQVMLRELRRRAPLEVTVLGRRPVDAIARHGVDHAVALHDAPKKVLMDCLGALDLLVLGGGGILFDREVVVLSRVLLLAAEVGTPVVTWGLGAGPLSDPDERALLARALRTVELLTVRDGASQRLLEEIAPGLDVGVTVDPGSVLDEEAFDDAMLASEGIDPSAMLLAVSIRAPGVAAPAIGTRRHALLADVVDYFHDRADAFAIFVPMEHADRNEAHAVATRVAHPDRLCVLRRDYRPGQVRGLLGRVGVAVGLRLHFLFFAARAGTPCLGLSYGPKLTAAASAGVQLLPLETAGVGQVLAALERQRERGRPPREVLERTREMARRDVARVAEAIIDRLHGSRPRAGRRSANGSAPRGPMGEQADAS